MPEFAIAGRPINSNRPPYLVAEAGINHNGELAKAMEMIAVAKDAGADAIKFQTFRADELIGDPQLTYSYRSQGETVTESMLSLFRRCELERSAWSELKAECDRRGITFMSTPQNLDDLDLLLDLDIPAIKIGSDDFTNLPLLKSFAATGLPIILSCGMADGAEIERSLNAIGFMQGYPVALLLCTSLYPTPPEAVNLARLSALRAANPKLTLGFSDHTEGTLASSLAAALGASIFEKHFTLDVSLPGPDHWFSLDPPALAAWVHAVRTAHTMLGAAALKPAPAELAMRKLARRSVIALRAIARGERFTAANVGVRRPGTGLPPECYDVVVGAVAARDIERGAPVFDSDLIR